MSCINRKKRFQTWKKQQPQEDLWNSDVISILSFLENLQQILLWPKGRELWVTRWAEHPGLCQWPPHPAPGPPPTAAWGPNPTCHGNRIPYFSASLDVFILCCTLWILDILNFLIFVERVRRLLVFSWRELTSSAVHFNLIHAPLWPGQEGFPAVCRGF